MEREDMSIDARDQRVSEICARFPDLKSSDFCQYHALKRSEKKAWQTRILDILATHPIAVNFLAPAYGIQEGSIRNWQKNHSAPSAKRIRLGLPDMPRTLAQCTPIKLVIPETLFPRTWADFACKGHAHGRCLTYKRVNGNIWNLVDDQQVMTLGQWDVWYRQQLASKEPIDTLYYLTDVYILHLITQQVQESNKFLMDLRDQGIDSGPDSRVLSLNCYISLVDRTIRCPQWSDFMLDVAPVLPGIEILTPPASGTGARSSIHFQVCGSGHNLVHVYQLAPEEEEYFQLHARGLQDQDHADGYVFDASPSDHWDAACEAKLKERGIVPSVIRLAHGEALLIPARWPRIFKKVCDTQTPSTPLLSFSLNTTYIGEDFETASLMLRYIVEDHRRLRVQRQKPYCYWEIALWCLVIVYKNKAHAEAALPYLIQMLDNQEKAWANLPAQTKKTCEPASDVEMKTYICCKCRVCLWNLMFVPPDGKPFVCYECSDNGKDTTVVYRFLHPRASHRTFNQFLEKLGLAPRTTQIFTADDEDFVFKVKLCSDNPLK